MRMNSLSRRTLLGGLGATALSGVAGCLGGGGSGSDNQQSADPAWYEATLTDVLTDESFRIADFERPVLLEPFAVWCSNCLRQQEEMIAFHDAVGDDVVSISIDIDENEDAQTVREHAQRHGFDWRYVVAPAAVTEALVDQFGSSIANPPAVPMVLVCPDGLVRRLKDGHKETAFLRSQVDTCG